jgi:hypothetical protein
MKLFIAQLITLLMLVAPGLAGAQQPSVEQFKHVLDAQLQKVKSEGTTARAVLFQEVLPGNPNGGYYPFLVTAVIHDYSQGYPPNGFYGETCVGKMEKRKFDLIANEFGGWKVQGPMTILGPECKKNPSEGVSAIPLAGLAGAPAGNGPAEAMGAARPTSPDGGNLYLGEYACYGAGNQLMAGMSFQLERSGKYHDTSGQRAGNYVYDARVSTISFRGGFLSNQTGRNVRNTGFQLSSSVHCEPWR